MKTLLLILALIPSLSFAATPDAEIARKAGVIGKVAFGIQTHKVRAENAEEMILRLKMKDSGESIKEAREDFVPNARAKDIGFSEEVNWGTLSPSEATKFFANLPGHQDKENGEEMDSSKRIALGQQIIKELGKMGAKFGFTSSSSGYCGIGFRGLLIVDEEGDTIYEISMSDSGSC